MSGPSPLVILGAGGHGREAASIVADVNAVSPTWNLLGVLDDGSPDRDLLSALGVDYLGGTGRLAELAAAYVIGIGAPAERRRFDAWAQGLGRVPATLIHPRAGLARDVRPGPGAILGPQANVMTNVTFGRHVHVNTAATIGHDCRLGDYVMVAPGARLSGTVVVEPDVWVGTGAIVIQNLRVGRGSVVGAGAVVVRDLPAGVVAVGVPARVLRSTRAPRPAQGARAVPAAR